MKLGRVISFIVAMIFLSACGDNIDSNMSESMTEFEFTTQDEEILSLEDLKDDWWIANFAYTSCWTICPRTTANMVHVQKELKDSNHRAPQIITFTIDPANDTPELLKAYAKEYGADLDTWSFLTGYDFATIQGISKNTFKATLEEGALGQRSHGYAAYLINPNAEIVKEYDGMSSDALDILVEDLKTVMKQ